MSELSSNFATAQFPPPAISAPIPSSDNSMSSPPMHHNIQTVQSVNVAKSSTLDNSAPMLSQNAMPASLTINSSAGPTETITKTPNLQSNMFKMQRNRSNFFFFLIFSLLFNFTFIAC